MYVQKYKIHMQFFMKLLKTPPIGLNNEKKINTLICKQDFLILYFQRANVYQIK